MLDAIEGIGLGIFLGTICFFAEIYRPKRNLLHQMKMCPIKIRIFDLLFIILMLLVLSKMLLSFNFSILICFFILFFSVLDIILYKHIKDFKPWWQDFRMYKKIALVFFALVLLFETYLLKGKNDFAMTAWVLFFCFFSLFLMCLKSQYNNFEKIEVKSNILSVLKFFQNASGQFLYFAYQFYAIIVVVVTIDIIYSDVVDPSGNRSDRCMDTGLCNEGYVFNNCDGKGNTCTVNKEFCLQRNNIWYEESKSCNTRKSKQ